MSSSSSGTKWLPGAWWLKSLAPRMQCSHYRCSLTALNSALENTNLTRETLCMAEADPNQTRRGGCRRWKDARDSSISCFLLLCASFRLMQGSSCEPAPRWQPQACLPHLPVSSQESQLSDLLAWAHLNHSLRKGGDHVPLACPNPRLWSSIQTGRAVTSGVVSRSWGTGLSR